MKLRSWCLLAVLATSVVGCGHARPTSQDRSAALNIVNHSDLSICEVQLAPGDQLYWGENHLEVEQEIAPNDGTTLYTRAGEYSVRLGDCRGATLYVRRGLQVAGTRTVVFRPVGVQRHPRFGARRYAGSAEPNQF